MSRIQLRKMDERGFQAYVDRFIEEYAQDISRSYEIDMDTARESAAAQTSEMLPQGLDTPGCFIYNVEQPTNSGTTCIGYVQYSIPSGETFASLDDIELFEPYQNQGHGTQVLSLLQRELDEMGIKDISLCVAADNERALAFYQRRGFRFTDHQMFKGLGLDLDLESEGWTDVNLVRIRKMDEQGFQDFKAFSVEKNAQEMCRAEGIDIKTARESAAAQTNESWSQGLDRPGYLIYYVEQPTNSETICIGYLACFAPSGETFAWLNSVDIFEPYQNQGVDAQALFLLEQELAEMGLRSINVHIAAHNERALALYQKRGFRFTYHAMEKTWI